MESAYTHGWRHTARAMSQGNVEIARQAIEAWNAGDMDALRALYDPEAVCAKPA